VDLLHARSALSGLDHRPGRKSGPPAVTAHVGRDGERVLGNRVATLGTPQQRSHADRVPEVVDDDRAASGLASNARSLQELAKDVMYGPVGQGGAAMGNKHVPVGARESPPSLQASVERDVALENVPRRAEKPIRPDHRRVVPFTVAARIRVVDERPLEDGLDHPYERVMHHTVAVRRRADEPELGSTIVKLRYGPGRYARESSSSPSRSISPSSSKWNARA